MLINKKEKQDNLIKAIIAFFKLINNNNIKLALITKKYNLDILIFKTYKKAINNINYN